MGCRRPSSSHTSNGSNRFESFRESALLDGSDTDLAWGRGFLEGLAAAAFYGLSAEQAQRFGALLDAIRAEEGHRRQGGAGWIVLLGF